MGSFPETQIDANAEKFSVLTGYVYGVRLQTKVRVNQDTFCMIMN